MEGGEEDQEEVLNDLLVYKQSRLQEWKGEETFDGFKTFTNAGRRLLCRKVSGHALHRNAGLGGLWLIFIFFETEDSTRLDEEGKS